MANDRNASARNDAPTGVKAVLGPTNTGKTHLAIERMCAHSSGMIGFPLRLLAREVYDRVVKIKGENSVALITGEERIEPKSARYLICTAEAMPVMERSMAFVAIDEAQLAADRERGHVFTDRLLHARGREETMILGSSTIEPLVRALVPGVEIVTRPRFSTLTHAGAKKLSRVPPRSAIVAFSSEQVYAIAEMLRRFRGGAAVVMGALSPQTRNAQVALYQSGEVDYLVATDAIGMGLNLDVEHVAFAGLSKYDGRRHRRLTTAEMAQIAGRAGRHQKDGTFGTLTGSGGHDSEFEPDEVYAIEEHRFAPLTKLFWREPEPRFDSLGTLIADLEIRPDRPELAPAPEAIDLAVLKRLADEGDVADTVRGFGQVRRFWEVCRLPDFRQQGIETHSRFVARLWQDLRSGELGADFVAGQIAQLDRTGGDIDTLQGRIAAIRSWAYIAQRPDWVLARDEMAARARAVEARLSDALHGKLTERFINRRTAVLMKKLGPDAALLSVRLEDEEVLVEGEHIGSLRGFAFQVDPGARLSDRKLLLAAAEKHLSRLLQKRADALVETIAGEDGAAAITLEDGALVWDNQKLASLAPGRSLLTPLVVPDRTLDAVPAPSRKALVAALERWLDTALKPLAPLIKLDEASRAADAGPDLRALLITLVERGGMAPRDDTGVDRLDKGRRTMLARLGVKVGALDLFVPAMLRTQAIALWREMARIAGKPNGPSPEPHMAPTLPAENHRVTPGYRSLGKQLLRLDMAEKLLREAHDLRARTDRAAAGFLLDPARAVSMGLTTASYARLLRLAGFQPLMPRSLAAEVHGAPAPVRWRWRPARRQIEPERPAPPRPGGVFAALADMVR
ncbi:helicase-related protein [Novosphingobium sp. P6W]|uniref:helicase-related protein n=1 Tax=Novosphingobium sp. P6W TaxID=1609758 RepID=UPI0005C3179A|nr:helicase-related protein [Novosphingobium sp. P6W]AXB75165.1 helicase [Novosphingobium sp. P6W]KIS32777.1 helicase [Novosphingobium sp. P6W]